MMHNAQVISYLKCHVEYVRGRKKTGTKKKQLVRCLGRDNQPWDLDDIKNITRRLLFILDVIVPLVVKRTVYHHHQNMTITNSPHAQTKCQPWLSLCVHITHTLAGKKKGLKHATRHVCMHSAAADERVLLPLLLRWVEYKFMRVYMSDDILSSLLTLRVHC